MKKALAGLTVGIALAAAAGAGALAPQHAEARTVYIGDSRTYFMCNAIYGEQTHEAVEAGFVVGDQAWVARCSAAYDTNLGGSATGHGNGSFKETLMPNADTFVHPGDKVYILMGANDAGKHAGAYVDLVNEYRKKANWQNTKVKFVTVTPFSIESKTVNKQARSFNKALKRKARKSKYKVIDAYKKMAHYRSPEYYRNKDTIHYSSPFSLILYNIVNR